MHIHFEGSDEYKVLDGKKIVTIWSINNIGSQEIDLSESSGDIYFESKVKVITNEEDEFITEAATKIKISEQITVLIVENS